MLTMILSPIEWKQLAESAHLSIFGEVRDRGLDRIDFCIVIGDQSVPFSYATIRELDSKTAYMQYGGAFPLTQKSIKAFNCYLLTVKFLEEKGYARITTLIENTNTSMIKFALKLGFLIIGIRTFENKIYCEFLKKFKEE